MPARSLLQAQMTVGERYRLVRRIGADDHVETWEAFDARLDRPVALRLLADAARDDAAARDELRGAARGPALAGAAGTAPRVLDGGEDPTYGPFVVAELNAAFDATHPIATINSEPLSGEVGRDAGSGEPAAPRRQSLLRSAPRSFPRRPPAAPDAPAPAETRSAEAGATDTTAPAGAVEPSGPAGTLDAAAGRGTSGRAMTGPIALAVVLLLVCGAVGVAFAARAALSGQPTRDTAPTAEATTAKATAATAGPAPPPAAAARPTSAPTPQPPAAPATSPADTIRQHYALIGARRYADGYALMDARLRAQFSPATYASWFAQKVAIQPTSVDTVSQNTQQAVVRATVLSTDTVKGRDVTSQVTEEFVLVPENGAWHIDSVTRLDERPAPRGHDQPVRQNGHGDHDNEGDD